jgi:hypothetical protein
MADFTPRSKLLKFFASDEGFSYSPTCIHELQFLFGCVKHLSENTELAIVQLILSEQMGKLVPLAIGESKSTAIQYGFYFDQCSLVRQYFQIWQIRYSNCSTEKAV